MKCERYSQRSQPSASKQASIPGNYKDIYTIFEYNIICIHEPIRIINIYSRPAASASVQLSSAVFRPWKLPMNNQFHLKVFSWFHIYFFFPLFFIKKCYVILRCSTSSTTTTTIASWLPINWWPSFLNIYLLFYVKTRCMYKKSY